MPNLSWPEIKHRATVFAREWRNTESERAEAQTFWNEFFQIFGVKRRSVAVYEQQVDRLPEHGHTAHGRIDLLWPGTLLAEHKSAGRDLDAAQRATIDTAAHGVHVARAQHAGAPLARLYDPSTMPPNLLHAHAQLDRAALPLTPVLAMPNARPSCSAATRNSPAWFERCNTRHKRYPRPSLHARLDRITYPTC